MLHLQDIYEHSMLHLQDIYDINDMIYYKIFMIKRF